MFINQSQSEYGQSLLYHGLRKLGHFVQCVFPNTFHFDKLIECSGNCNDRYLSPCKLETTFGCNIHPSHLTFNPQHLAGDITKHEWDLVITNNGYGNEPLHRLLSSSNKIAALDLGDSKSSSIDAWTKVIGKKPDYFFRREFIEGQEGFPFSYSFFREKNRFTALQFMEWTVTSLYRPTNPKRQKISEALKKEFGEKCFVGQKPHIEYLNTLARSKFSVALAGAGEDTLRHWEIASQGSVLCMERQSITINNAFKDGENCIIFDSVEELISKIKKYEEDEEEYKRLRGACYLHFLKFHTTEARAQELLTRCGI